MRSWKMLMASAGIASLITAGCTGPAEQPPRPVNPPSRTSTPTATLSGCTADARLVPSCGVLWGAAAGGFTATPRDAALRAWEVTTGRTATIFHTYHRGDELFPTAAEVAMTRDRQHPRVLLLNWKVTRGTTWARAAAGEQDARLDRWAAYVKRTYDRPFFLVLDHEPEKDVDATAGSGMTATDFAAMYRHVVSRLRADGVINAIFVLAYMGNEKWMATPWWNGLYPGDDYVDWIGLDSYVSVEAGTYHYGTFGDLLNRPAAGGGAGFYDWSVGRHPGKPVMVAEWGMYHRTEVSVSKAAAFDTVLPELKTHPAIKAIVYFDTVSDKFGDRDISATTEDDAVAAVRRLAADPLFDVTLP